MRARTGGLLAGAVLSEVTATLALRAATGVTLTALAGAVLFAEPLTPVTGAGIALIVGGVLLVELGARHPGEDA
ncbi:hypothetical protein AB2L27_15830 [Kineococcus sp. LSe6-4]|uniref:EamA family transporter n=1 Tax=Kineococcus halophytocola TaxID=3234027 RepID=A0ABV4H3S4_9ACTN